MSVQWLCRADPDLTTRIASFRILDMNSPNGSKFSILSEFWGFMKERKKWWLGPIVFMMLLLSLLIVLSQGSAVAPFIYTLF